MTDDNIQTLNYSAHALEDLRKMRSSLSGPLPDSARMIDEVIRLLQVSVKFILPNCCSLIAPDELKQSHVDLARLPFPCVAFETPWVTGELFVENNIGGVPQVEVTRRIALCWESGHNTGPLDGLNRFLDVYPEGGVYVLPVYWGAELAGWMPGIGGVFCPYNDTLQSGATVSEQPIASRIANAAMIEAGLAAVDGDRLIAEPFTILPDAYQYSIDVLGSKAKADADIINNARDECQIQLQACCVLACANVESDDIEPSAKLNKKRVARGRQPLFSYKVLALSDDKRASGASQGGSHASPRMHLRRGHLRRLKERVIWVRPSMVNVNSLDGVVVKDYDLT